MKILNLINIENDIKRYVDGLASNNYLPQIGVKNNKLLVPCSKDFYLKLNRKTRKIGRICL